MATSPPLPLRPPLRRGEPIAPPPPRKNAQFVELARQERKLTLAHSRRNAEGEYQRIEEWHDGLVVIEGRASELDHLVRKAFLARDGLAVGGGLRVRVLGRRRHLAAATV